MLCYIILYCIILYYTNVTLVLQELAAQCRQLRHSSFLAHYCHLPLYHSTSHSLTCRQTTSHTHKCTQHWYDYHKPSPIYLSKIYHTRLERALSTLSAACTHARTHARPHCMVTRPECTPKPVPLRSRDVLERLTVSQLVKKFLAFYGTRRFIAVFTTARHLSLSWASSVQPTPPLPKSYSITYEIKFPSASFAVYYVYLPPVYPLEYYYSWQSELPSNLQRNLGHKFKTQILE